MPDFCPHRTTGTDENGQAHRREGDQHPPASGQASSSRVSIPGTDGLNLPIRTAQLGALCLLFKRNPKSVKTGGLGRVRTGGNRPELLSDWSEARADALHLCES